MIAISRMTADHVEGYHVVLDIVARENRFLALLEAPSLLRTAEFVLECSQNGDPQFVALDAGKVVGWCDILRHKKPVHHHCGTLGMGLLPGYRGRGIGTRLATRTIVEANRVGINRIELTVFTSNTDAIRLYRKLGFKSEGRHPKAALIDGRYISTMTMALLSVPGPDEELPEP
jgi:RimJ/RimL family protein N-acetyltransferase